ncbi:threonine--tRNA ligase [Mycoplasmoides pneumoniae]|uniref:threonine--tRNA ligase n=1 Tax=Mycoplasmoides pneumoniae TaxID=2104 RepID=UPI00071B9218|nr:threonine--tRNA ligase [Mycoplasmoides pneumoniae]
MLAGVLLLQSWLKANYPQVQFGSYGVQEGEFYLDFKVEKSFSIKEFEQLEQDLNAYFNQLNNVVQTKIDKTKSLKFFQADPFTTTLIESIESNSLVVTTVNEQTFWVHDLVLPLPKQGFVKLLNVSANYFLGDPTKPQLQRLVGIFAASKEQLKSLIAANEQKYQNDHRAIGKRLEIFTFDPLVGSGFPIWLEKGAVLKKIIGDFVHYQQLMFGFKTVSSPVLANLELYKISGHYVHYSEDMFPSVKLENQMMMLRPMTCPHHCLIFKHKRRSYKELPQRFCEDSILHRFEASGGLTGLERVRCMTLLDNHIFCRTDQIKAEIKNAFKLIQTVNNKFGFSFDRIDLALHDPNNKAKFIDNDQLWANSESQIESVFKELNVPYKIDVGAAAFYGPKIDFQFKTALNKMITIATIQLDFLLPERFELRYFDEQSNAQTPVIIHVGIVGTYERFIAALLEKTHGNLPLWMAPVQVVVIPVNIDKHEKAAKKLYQKLLKENIRVSLDESEDRLGKKVRTAIVNKIPLQIIVGDKEMQDLTRITCRGFKGEKVQKLYWANFVKKVRKDG